MPSGSAGNRRAEGSSRRASRFLRALAVTLPLGLDPHLQAGGAPPLAPVPAELLADREALGAIGVLWDEGRVCVSLGLRRGDAAPEVRHSLWRPSAGPSRGTVLALEKLPATSTAGEFELWSACARAASPRAGATLSTLLVDRGDAGAQRRRIDLPSGAPGTWAWRVIHPLESSAEVLPATAETPRVPAAASDAAVDPASHGG